MDIELFYWHWLLLGMALMVAEIFIPTFTILWFGLGAIIVGLALLVVSMSLSLQLLLWAISSIMFVLLWFKVFKPRMIDRTAEQSSIESVIGEFGQVVKAPTGASRGRVRFVTPILGSDEWEFVTEDDVRIGDRVFIEQVSGDTLTVVKQA